jgi:CPA1 family monovalent cation:H+ antiporter
LYCSLFGALISPTDPIAVLGILTKANVPPKIENTIVGESLFNDGIGVVIYRVQVPIQAQICSAGNEQGASVPEKVFKFILHELQYRLLNGTDPLTH